MREPGFLRTILADGPHHRVSLRENGASLYPLDETDEALNDFQAVVREVMDHDGEGYSVHLTHGLKDRPGDLVDLVLLRLDS